MAYKTITRTKTTTTKNDFVVNKGELSTSKSVGDFITDIRFLPYLRSKVVKVHITGLKPDTRHYFFFDGKDVNAHVAPGKAYTAVKPWRQIRRSGRFGAAIRTDEDGVLLAVFKIPEGTFHVGSNTLQVCDVATLAEINNTSSKAQGVYRGFNYSVEKQESTIATREPEISVDSSTSVKIDRRVHITTGVENREGGYPDDGNQV
jgi:hypothetical protein